MSAGLETINIFRQQVAIMENENQDLELVFRSGRDDEEVGYQRVKYNKYY
jgi:hypothetical protein